MALLAVTAGCDAPSDLQKKAGITPQYDSKTGRLERLDYDADHNGQVDTVSFMDGSRIIRIEIDKNEDGKVERWEYYGADQKLEKVGFSRADDGKEDAWSYAGADGAVARIDVSTARDGKITRTEHYEQETLVRADEDADADGRPDKWETYQSGRLIMVAFDTSRRGSPDRRLVYGSDGSARLEVDPDGDGTFAVQK